MLSLVRNEWRFLLFGFLMTFWSAPGQTFFISLFSGEIRSGLGLTDGQFGALYSAATLMSAMVMVWSGSLLDRMDLEKFSLAAICGLAAACMVMAMSNGILVLLVGIFLLRQMGQGLMCLISSTSMVRYLDRNKGKSSALAGMGYAVSEAVMPSMVVALILWAGWRQSWLIVAGMLLVFMVPAVRILLREHAERHRVYMDELANEGETAGEKENRGKLGKKIHWTRSEVIRDKRFYLILPGLMSQQLMFTGFIFHQIHLVESKGWSLTGWASLFAVYAMVSVATKVISGFIVDAYGAIKLVPMVGLPMGIGLYVLSATSSLAWGGVFLVLTGITVGMQSTVAAPFWSEFYGNRYLASIKSMAASVMILFTALSPVVLGVLIDRGVSMESLAFGSCIYMLLTSALAWYGCSLPGNHPNSVVE